MEPHATGLPVPGQLGNAIGRPMPGLGSPGQRHRMEECFATSLLMCWHLEFSIGRPTPSKGHRVGKRGSPETATVGTWFLSDWPISSHNKPRDSTAGKSSNSIIVTKTSKSSTYTFASSVDSALPWAVVMSAGSLEFLLVPFLTKSKFTLTYRVERCAAVNNEFSIFMVTI